MPENNLSLIARLRELHAKATKSKRGLAWQYSDEELALHQATVDALPAILDALEAAVKERDELRADRHFAVDMIRHLDPENLCDFIDELGAEEHLRQWLAARDARMKKLGAIEAYDEMRKQAVEVGKESGLAAKFCKLFAEQCIEAAAQLRRESEER